VVNASPGRATGLVGLAPNAPLRDSLGFSPNFA